MGGRDDPDAFYIEELDELELDEATASPEERAALAAAAKRRSLADRAPQPMSAKEALAAAFAAERQAKEQQAQMALEEKRRVAAEARARAEEARRRAEQEAREAEEARRREAADRAAFAARGAPAAPSRPVRRGPMVSSSPTDPLGRMMAEGRVEKLLGLLGEGFEVAEVFVDVPTPVVGPLWDSHVVRAVHDGDLTLAAMADHVRSVVRSRPTDLVAARVVRGSDEWAVWVDLDDDRLLCALQPAAVYLVGL